MCDQLFKTCDAASLPRRIASSCIISNIPFESAECGLCPAGCELQLQLPVSKELLTSSKHVGVLILLLCAEKEKQTSGNGLHTHATGHSSGWVTHCCSRSGRHPLGVKFLYGYIMVLISISCSFVI